MIRWRAPGKVMIAGEYSVLGPAGAALALAITEGVEVQLSPAPRWQLFRADLNLCWEEGSPNVPAALRFAHAAWQVSLGSLDLQQRPPSHRLSLSSWSGAATEAEQPGATLPRISSVKKPGFGGSASTVVAVTAALLQNNGTDFSAPGARSSLLQLALEAHGQAQGQRGSGYDVATITLGGVVCWRPSRWIRPASANEGAKQLAWPAGLFFLVGYCGQSAKTAHLLAKLEAYRAEAPRELDAELTHLSAPANTLINAFQDGSCPSILAAVSPCQEALAAWDRQHHFGIITPAIARLIQLAASAGASAKISGAGGGDSVIAFSDDPQRLAHLGSIWHQEGFTPLFVQLYAAGVGAINASSA